MTFVFATTHTFFLRSICFVYLSFVRFCSRFIRLYLHLLFYVYVYLFVYFTFTFVPFSPGCCCFSVPRYVLFSSFTCSFVWFTHTLHLFVYVCSRCVLTFYRVTFTPFTFVYYYVRLSRLPCPSYFVHVCFAFATFAFCSCWRLLFYPHLYVAFGFCLQFSTFPVPPLPFPVYVLRCSRYFYFTFTYVPFLLCCLFPPTLLHFYFSLHLVVPFAVRLFILFVLTLRSTHLRLLHVPVYVVTFYVCLLFVCSLLVLLFYPSYRLFQFVVYLRSTFPVLSVLVVPVSITFYVFATYVVYLHVVACPACLYALPCTLPLPCLALPLLVPCPLPMPLCLALPSPITCPLPCLALVHAPCPLPCPIVPCPCTCPHMPCLALPCLYCIVLYCMDQLPYQQ